MSLNELIPDLFCALSEDTHGLFVAALSVSRGTE